MSYGARAGVGPKPWCLAKLSRGSDAKPPALGAYRVAGLPAGNRRQPASHSRHCPAALKRGVNDVDSKDAGSNPEAKPESRPAAKVRRLIADQQYFGLDAKSLHDGAGRTLTRLSTATPRIDVHTLGEDFGLDAAASWTLLRALLGGGLLLSDGPGTYRPSARFREYALAELVMPMSRSYAKDLLAKARELAARINANWGRNPYLIRMILVSGSYMSRSDRLPELSLWLVLRRRHELRTRRWNHGLSKSNAMRQIASAMKELDPLVVVHVAADKQAVPRPFSVAFQAADDFGEPSVHSWDRVRSWGASISRRLTLK
jgi:hypothetical protein